MTTRERELGWSHGRFTILPTAGMLASAEFDLGDRVFRPFARADWMGTITDPGMVGHLRDLGGEFVGIPFGSSPPPLGMTEHWARCVGTHCNLTAHGPSADLDWEIVSCGNGAVHMQLAYDDVSPIARLDRHVTGREGSPVLDFRLEIHARRLAEVAVGLHPIFRLPETPGQLQIDAGFELGQTYPGLISPGKTVSQPNRDFSSLAAVPAPDGEVNLARLPLGPPVEDVVLLGGATGPAVLRYMDDRASATLDWDRTVLPSLMLWISDHGAEDPPFSGRYRGLGVEPLAAAFDLADAVSTAPNPLNARGIRTAVSITPEAPVRIAYSVAAAPL